MTNENVEESVPASENTPEPVPEPVAEVVAAPEPEASPDAEAIVEPVAPVQPVAPEAVPGPVVAPEPEVLAAKAAPAPAPLPEPAAEEPAEDFGALLSAFEKSHSHKSASAPRQLQGTVISLSADQVFLDIGYKTEGVLPRSAFDNDAEAVKPGDSFPVSVSKWPRYATGPPLKQPSLRSSPSSAP